MKEQRLHMVRDQLVRRGIADQKVLDVLQITPRHLFVPDHLRDLAYSDGPLPIGYNQTISQPYIVAFMTEMLNVESHHTVLEIGTGCGYQTAVLSQLAEKVVSVEIVPKLASEAKLRLQNLGYDNVDVNCADGKQGWKPDAPYDRIIVTASPEAIPTPLINQLNINGKMILPVGSSVHHQELQLVLKNEQGEIDIRRSLPVRFVPLVDKS